jgi:hypothetical protein
LEGKRNPSFKPPQCIAPLLFINITDIKFCIILPASKGLGVSAGWAPEIRNRLGQRNKTVGWSALQLLRDVDESQLC